MKHNTKIIVSALISILLVGGLLFASFAGDAVVDEDAYPSEEISSGTEELSSDAAEHASDKAEPVSEDISEDISEEVSSDTARVYTLGDVNGDGYIHADDARLALRASARLETLSDAQLIAADVNGDGKLFANDARQILRVSAKLQAGFEKAPSEEASSEPASI